MVEIFLFEHAFLHMMFVAYRKICGIDMFLHSILLFLSNYVNFWPSKTKKNDEAIRFKTCHNMT